MDVGGGPSAPSEKGPVVGLRSLSDSFFRRKALKKILKMDKEMKKINRFIFVGFSVGFDDKIGVLDLSDTVR